MSRTNNSSCTKIGLHTGLITGRFERSHHYFNRTKLGSYDKVWKGCGQKSLWLAPQPGKCICKISQHVYLDNKKISGSYKMKNVKFSLRVKSLKNLAVVEKRAVS